MDQVPQSSFIPRQTGNAVLEPPRRRRGRLNLLSFFSLVSFFGALMLSVGVFLLKQTNVEMLESRKQELSERRNLFKQDDIESIRQLDTQIRTATYLLDGHVAPSVLLDLLERTTQDEIQYTDFAFARRPSGSVSVTMTGIAPRFNTVARQAMRFADENFFRRVIFSGLDKPIPEYVTFEVNFDIAKDAIAYDVDISALDTLDASVDVTTEGVASSTDEALDLEPVTGNDSNDL